MNRNTGAVLSGTAHIRQSVQDILSTPTGTRVMLPEYGSDLLTLVDAPDDRLTQIRLVMATAVALDKWEPRITVQSVSASRTGAGRLTVDLTTTDTETQKIIRLEGLTV
ncbi:GPW/gp25 family protein [Enterobacter cloacae complex sp. I2]|uniref:GPW/gp25 family protein n=1 Tax=Enterobacter cloacae complex sp. I2 TaxID=2779603 RepID=UPI001D0040AB|nr:GPW/gp25 family protein [Enterobacter cloacae complex sp. I2]